MLMVNKGTMMSALKLQVITRQFHYNGTKLPDPGVGLSPEQVREVYAAAYPELTTANISSPVIKGNLQIFSFEVSAGTKA